MSDRELLEAAAKAAGLLAGATWVDGGEPYSGGPGLVLQSNRLWNALLDRGDALSLAVKLRLHLAVEMNCVSAWPHDGYGNFKSESFSGCDEEAATCRAIVRAAAALAA